MPAESPARPVFSATMTPKVLLLQARMPDDPMQAQELECFVERTGLPASSFTCHNLYDGAPRMGQLRERDALMVGGSGAFYISSGNLPEFETLLDFLREVVAAGHPTFASCFGYQALVRALGGEVISDRAHREVGTFELTLTTAALHDELFGGLPERVMAQMGHTDRVERPAEGAINLASSEMCRHQALRVPHKPVWATQFHPELDRKRNAERFRTYFESYGRKEDRQDLDAALRRFRESPETTGLLAAFLELVLGWSANLAR